MNKVSISIVILLTIFVSAEAHAQWVYNGNESAFGDSGLHIAATGIGAYGFGLRCSGERLEALYMTPDTSFDKATYATANMMKPKLLVRVDDLGVVNLEGELIDVDGKAAIVADTDLDLVHSVRDAKRRIAVVMQLVGQNFHEQSFNVRGSTSAANKMLAGCNLSQ